MTKQSGTPSIPQYNTYHVAEVTLEITIKSNIIVDKKEVNNLMNAMAIAQAEFKTLLNSKEMNSSKVYATRAEMKTINTTNNDNLAVGDIVWL